VTSTSNIRSKNNNYKWNAHIPSTVPNNHSVWHCSFSNKKIVYGTAAIKTISLVLLLLAWYIFQLSTHLLIQKFYFLHLFTFTLVKVKFTCFPKCKISAITINMYNKDTSTLLCGQSYQFRVMIYNVLLYLSIHSPYTILWQKMAHGQVSTIR